MKKIVYICPLCRDMTIVVDHVTEENTDLELPDLILCDGKADHACHREQAHQSRQAWPQTIIATHETFVNDDGILEIRRK